MLAEKQAESPLFLSWPHILTPKERRHNKLSVPYSCEALSHLSSAFCIFESPSIGPNDCKKNPEELVKYNGLVK